MHVVRHNLNLDNLYVVVMRNLAYASFRKIFMLELAEYVVAVLCAPYNVPQRFPYCAVDALVLKFHFSSSERKAHAKLMALRGGNFSFATLFLF